MIKIELRLLLSPGGFTYQEQESSKQTEFQHPFPFLIAMLIKDEKAFCLFVCLFVYTAGSY